MLRRMMHRCRRSVLVVVSLVLVAAAGAACSGNDDDAAGSATSSTGPVDVGDVDGDGDSARFCDVYLTYLADSSPEHLAAVAGSTDDDQVNEYASIIAEDPNTGRVLAATEDLDELARAQCQPEWTAGAQGAGSTAAAAQAFFDALVAGDRLGARNIASANAIAVFEPWEPVPGGDESGAPALGEVTERNFTVVLSADQLAQCQVEVGVVVTCQRT